MRCRRVGRPWRRRLLDPNISAQRWPETTLLLLALLLLLLLLLSSGLIWTAAPQTPVENSDIVATSCAQLPFAAWQLELLRPTGIVRKTTVKRREYLSLLAALPLGAISARASQSAEWEAWKDSFLTADGRVVDALQRNASHSEGQGYGMVLAALQGDARAFKALFAWTEAHLAVRDDALLAWRWLPDSDPHIGDYNNASDGDLFYAYALLLGAQRFGEDAYNERAGEVAAAVVDICVRRDPSDQSRRVLLPAAEAFDDGARLVVNPSYIMPKAMTALSDRFDLRELKQAANDGVDLIAALAKQGPVPDWIELDSAGIRPAGGFAAQSGYEAIRVALYLIWSGITDHIAVKRVSDLSSLIDISGVPTVVDLHGQVLRRSTYPGYEAIYALAQRAGSGVGQIPLFSAEQPYYPATLHMFASFAAQAKMPSR